MKIKTHTFGLNLKIAFPLFILHIEIEFLEPILSIIEFPPLPTRRALYMEKVLPARRRVLGGVRGADWFTARDVQWFYNVCACCVHCDDLLEIYEAALSTKSKWDITPYGWSCSLFLSAETQYKAILASNAFKTRRRAICFSIIFCVRSKMQAVSVFCLLYKYTFHASPNWWKGWFISMYLLNEFSF